MTIGTSLVREVHMRKARCMVCQRGGCKDCADSPEAFLASLEAYKRNEYYAQRALALMAMLDAKVAMSLHAQGIEAVGA